jgi:hypothetical protein
MMLSGPDSIHFSIKLNILVDFKKRAKQLFANYWRFISMYSNEMKKKK